jgi:hypothetical protein
VAFAQELPALEPSLGGHQQLVDLRGFREDLERAEPQAAGHDAADRVAREEDESHLGVLAQDLREQLDPAPLRMSSTSWPTQRNLATINTSRGGGDI